MVIIKQYTFNISNQFYYCSQLTIHLEQLVINERGGIKRYKNSLFSHRAAACLTTTRCRGLADWLGWLERRSREDDEEASVQSCGNDFGDLS